MLLDHERAHHLAHSHELLLEAARAGHAGALKRHLRQHLTDNEATILAGISRLTASAQG